MGSLKRNERLRIRGIAATTGVVKKGGKAYLITEEELKKAAKTSVGKAILHKHRGKPIGKVERAWYEDGKLYIEGVIYEPQNEMEEQMIEKMEKGERIGISPAFLFEAHRPPPPRVVLHGSLEVIGEEDGTLIVRTNMPKEEIIRKFGSIENIKNYVIGKLWIHDGSQESKKRIEHEFLEENEPMSG